MDQDTVVELVVQALTLAMKVAMPILLVGLVVGVAISLLQAITQIQEMTLSFIPKIVAMAVVLVVAGPWMLEQMLGYTTELYQRIPSLVGA